MKNKFLSRIGQWYTPPYLRKCLTSLKSLTLLLVMLMSVNVWGTNFSFGYEAWGESASFSGDAKDQVSQTIDGVVCTYTRNGSSLYANKSAIRFYQKNTIQFEAPDGYEITSISFNANNKTDITTDVPTCTVTESALSWSGRSTSVTFTRSSSGSSYATYSSATVTIQGASGKDVSITADSELNLTFEESDGTINVTYGEDVADKDINLYSDVECTTPFTGDWFTADFDASGNVEYVAGANTGAAREAYIQIYVMADDTETDNTKVIKVTQAKYAAPTGTFEKFTEDLEEGDYVITSQKSGETKAAMKAELTTTSTKRMVGVDIASVLSNEKITNPDASVIWHIAPDANNDGYWNFYNEQAGVYAAFTSTNGAATLLQPSNLSDYGRWQMDNNKEFTNKGKADKYLRYNKDVSAFASYATSTGTTLTLYKKQVPAVYSKITLATCENGSVNVTGADDLTSVASGTEITLGNTPDAGYTLDAYDVYKTGESATKVTITDGKFKMPAYGVTVSATFKTAKVLNSVEITTPASKTEYWVNEEFSTDGLVLTAHFADGDEVVTPTSITTPDMTTAGEKTITVSFTEGTTTKSDEYTIKVKTIANTEETAYTVAEAFALIDVNPTGLATTEVYVKGIVSSIPTPWSSQFNNITYNISDNGETTGQQFQLYRCATNGAEVGDKVIAKGKMKKFNSTYEFDAGNTIVSIRRAAKLEWSAGAYTAELGLAEYDYPTLTKTPTTLTGVTYSSSNTDVATIDAAGVITLKAEGETTITASFAGDATYDAAEDATYILTVAAEVQRFTITYNSNGGSVIDPVENQTNLPNEFPTPTKDWKVFGGWYLDNETFENPAVANAPLTDNTTLFAKWNDPLSVAEMIALIPNANDNKSDIYGYGYIKKVDKIDNGAAIYWITDGTNDFEVYKGKNINNENFTDASELPVGNKVMIFGNIKNYQGTHEFDANNYLLHNEVVTTPVTGVSLDKTAATVYVGQTTTLVANIIPTYATNKNVTWSSNKESVATVADGVVTGAAKGSATITVTTEDGNFTATCAVTVEELPIWATTYTSNVTVGTDKVRFSEDGEQYDAKKTGSGSSAGSIEIKVPVGTCELHYHAAAWSSKSETLYVKNGNSPVAEHSILADAGLKNNTPFTLENNPVDEYYMIKFEPALTEETTLTFSASSNRLILFGVNAIQPAAITIDPASKDFGEVKQGFDAEQVFALTPNAFATGTVTAEIDGDEVFTASAVADNKVTVTFAPTEIKDDYSATLVIKHDGTQMCTATLSGKGIAATTPEIAVSTDEIDFGKVKQDATVAAQTVTVTLNYLDAATASIDDDTYFSIDKTDLGAGANTITISATASSTGEKSAAITITGTGATTKTIAVKMDVTSKWAGEYTSNVEVGSDAVIIGGEEYEAIKKGTGSASQFTTVTVPKGTQTLHFHAAAWNNENTILVVKQGETELGSFNLYKDAGVKSSSPFTLAGNNYDTDQYFYVNVSAYTASDAAEITFTTTASPYRFVLYGVNQEGGIVPILDHLTITGSATHTEYEVDETFDPAGLTVSAIYTLEDVEQDPIDVTEDVEWEFTPATLTAGSYDVTVKAIYEDKEVSTTVAVTVIAATPEITVDATEVGFGTVLKDDEVDAKTVAVTLKAIAEATVAVTGDASAFDVTPASLTESGDITITPVTTTAGEFAATITISADGAEDKTVTVTMNVTDGNLPKEKVDFTEVYSDVTGSSTVDFASYSGVTFSLTAAKNDGNQPKYYANGSSVRAYAKNTITISSEKTIAFILINHTGKSYQDVEATVDNGTLKVNEAYSMWTLGATSGTLTLANTVRFDNITVYYEYDEVVRSAQSENQIGTGCQTLDIVAVKGATLYQVYYTTGSYLEFMEVTYPVKAGMPIIMQADNTNDGKIEVIYGQKSPVATEGSNKDGLYGYIGVGTYDIPNDEGYYVFKGGMLRPALDNYTTSGHAYIKLDEVPTEETVGSPAPRRRLSVGIERSMPTGFETIMMQKGMNKVIMNNQLYLIRDGKLFNAQGALVK